MQLELPKHLIKHNIKLETIFLKECHFHRKFSLTKKVKLAVPKLKVKIEYRLISKSKLTAYYSFFSVENSIIEYDIKFETIFSMKGATFTKKRAAEFIDVAGFFMVWPFFRQTMIDFTARLGFPPLIAPVLDVYKSIQKIVKKLSVVPGKK